MKNFRKILKQKCGSRFRKRGVNTHNKFQAPRTVRTRVMGQRVSGTNKTLKKNFFSSNFLFKILVVCPP